jgi:hypothetical protein
VVRDDVVRREAGQRIDQDSTDRRPVHTLRALTGILLAATVTAAMALIGGGVAGAATSALAGNNFQLRNVTTGKCADVKDRSTSTFAIIHQWSCSNEDNQRWAPVDEGNGFLTFHNQRSGWCMAVRDDANVNGAQIIQASCNSSAPGQLWRQVLLDVSGTSWVVSALGKCLEVNRASRDNGARIQILTCDTASNAQSWQFR